jgi:hypothetical protein
MTPKNRKRRSPDARPPLLDPRLHYESAIRALGDGNSTWELAELSFAWREARAEAAQAYDDWCAARNRASYTLYRAAQDRADAAQDALHEHHAAEQARAA